MCLISKVCSTRLYMKPDPLISAQLGSKYTCPLTDKDM